MELQFETLGLHVKVLAREVQNEELAARFRLKRERQVRDCEPKQEPTRTWQYSSM